MQDENLHTYTVYKYTVSHLNVVRERVVLEKKCTRGNYIKKQRLCVISVCSRNDVVRRYAGNVSPEYPNTAEYHVVCL